ncbi:AsmA family protein [Bradyrhizobium sp. Tv2a-2]|uniref:AsmA family protein n=1 Tax=Bradyrhizobium sp. Tv2a-2 TaxID=113395 RepID=UPI000418476A|nr:AsmA family protein [Bradyrhizobium sp. Tv2a-2]
MQTTLLGLAIALILALIAALIGPYYIDWNQFRPQFEAEATEIIGAPVRVSGDLQARLLPTPTLRLGSVTVGGPNDLGKVRADKLDVEFSLGELMRGQWRANELAIGGLSLDLGLDRDGRIDWPASSGKFNWASLSIDRLNLTGRIALHDAASRSTLELSDIAFSGDVRSAAGAVHGDGKVTVDGTRYPFRVSSGQSNDGSGGTRLHVNIDPGQRPVTAELEGLLNFEARAPRFEGTLALGLPPPPKGQPAGDRTPWKVTTKLKADHAAAQLDQIEASYGSDERALKFAGSGDVRFGAAPLLHAVLSARQLDADRLVTTDNGTDNSTEPVRLWPALRALMTDMPHPPLPVRIEASSEQIMLGGRPLQNLSAEFHGDRNSWAIDRLDLRAPGSTMVSFGAPPAGTSFSGVLDVDSADPDALMVWLRGRSDVAYRSQKPLRLHGNVTVRPDGVSVDGLKAEIEGGTVGGRIALSVPSPSSGAHLDTALQADQLDLDAAATFVRSVTGPTADWPAQAAVSLNVARARSSGQELRPLAVKFSYSPKIIALEQLNIGQGNGINVEGSGSFDRSDASGILTLRAAAPSLSQVTALVAPFAPAVAERLNAVGSPAGLARIKLALNIGKDREAADRAAARAVVDLSAPQLQGSVTLTARPQLAAVQGLDLDRLRASDVTVATELAAVRGDALLALLGLDHAVAAGEGPAQFEGSLSGKWQAPLQAAARIFGAGLDADAQGTLEPWGQQGAQDLKGSGTLRMRKANLAPLFGLKPSDSLLQNVSLSSHVALAGNRLTFEDLDGANGGSRLRGHLALTLGDQKEVQGEVGLDALDLRPAFALAIGASGHGGTEPLSAGLSKGWRGHVAFQALRGALPDNLELRPVSGVIRSDGQSITFDTLKGKIGGGDASATIDARDGAGGLAVNASVELKNVDGAALHYRNLRMPSSRVSLQMSLASQGRSVAALTGALTGNGTATLEGASIMGLDPRAFEVAIRASDAGQPTDDAKLKQLVEPVLASGALLVPTAQIPFTIRDGRLRVSATTLEGDGVRAIVSGGYDIPADQADVRATLSSTTIGSGSSQPEIQLFLAGPPGALTRSVDVTSLSSWLAVRVIDRETRRLDAIERGQLPAHETVAVPPSTAAMPMPAPQPKPPVIAPRPPVAPPVQAAPPSAPLAPSVAIPPATMSQQVPPLPPPIDVRPPPGPPPAAPRPKPRPPLVLTPPATTNQ